MKPFMQLDKDKLPVIGNPQTGTLFHVIGALDDLVIGARFWVEQPKHHKNMTGVGFRFRIQQVENSAAKPLVFREYCSAKFPEARWAGASDIHVSLAGEAILKAHIWDAGQVLGVLDANDVGGKIYDFLIEMVRAFDFDFSRDDFIDFVKKEVREQLKLMNNGFPGQQATPSVVIDFGHYQKQYKDGFDVTPILTEEMVGAAVGLGNGGPVVAPVAPVVAKSKADEEAQGMTNDVGDDNKVYPGGGEIPMTGYEESEGMPNMGGVATWQKVQDALKHALGGTGVDDGIQSL